MLQWGLVNLKFAEKILAARKTELVSICRSVKNIQEGLQLIKLTEPDGYNHAYFPVIFESETQLLNTKEELERHRWTRLFYLSSFAITFIGPKLIHLLLTVSHAAVFRFVMD